MTYEEPFLDYKRKLKACNGNMDRMASVLIDAKYDLRINKYQLLTLIGFAKDLEEP